MPCVPDDADVRVEPAVNHRWQNFVRTIDYEVPGYFRPQTRDELVWIVHRAETEGRRLKAVGSGWSIENIATSSDWVVDISALSRNLTYLLTGPGHRALSSRWASVSHGTSRTGESLVHVEAGIKLIELNRDLEPFRSMLTLGGSQGQTLAGAFSTGTHGSDFEFPPLCDLIEAIHLVTTGGEEVWIESSSHPVTDDDEALLAVLPCPETRIIRDDDALNAVRCGMGRFGVIYACVVRVRDQFRLAETAEHKNWSEVRSFLASGIGDPVNPFGNIDSVLSAPEYSLTGTGEAGYRYLDITFNTRKPDQCWVRRRWIPVFGRVDDLNVEASSNFLCHETIGNVILHAAATLLESYGLAMAGFPPLSIPILARASHLRTLALDPHMTGGAALAASINAITQSQIAGELSWMIDEISQIGLSGEFASATTTGKRGSNWHITSGVDETAFRPDCYNGSSIEVTFNLSTPAYLDFIDELRAHTGAFLQVGYVSVRFSDRSAALLSMHGHDYKVSCAVEVTSLEGLAGTEDWLRWLLSRAKELGGRPHWGQKNSLRAHEVERLYGERLERWRAQLLRIAGRSLTFSNSYTQQRGLEPINVRRRVVGVRRADGRITHLCGVEGEYWSPVPVETVEFELASGGARYYIASADGGAEQPIILRRILTTAADDSGSNNLDSLPDGRVGLPPPPEAMADLVVTSVVRMDDRWRSISHLCNIETGWCVTRSQAYLEIRNGTRRYSTLAEDGARAEILARSYLTTEPDSTTANNLESLPEC